MKFEEIPRGQPKLLTQILAKYDFLLLKVIVSSLSSARYKEWSHFEI